MATVQSVKSTAPSTAPASNEKIITNDGKDGLRRAVAKQKTNPKPVAQKSRTSAKRKKEVTPRDLARRITRDADLADQISFKVRDFKAGNFQGHHNNKRSKEVKDKKLEMFRARVPELFGNRFTWFPQDAVAIQLQDLQSLEKKLDSVRSTVSRLESKIPKMGDKQLDDREAELPKGQVIVSTFTNLYSLEAKRANGEYRMSLDTKDGLLIFTPTEQPPGPPKQKSSGPEPSIINKMLLQSMPASTPVNVATKAAFVIKLPDSVNLDDMKKALEFSQQEIIPNLIDSIQAQVDENNERLVDLRQAFSNRREDLIAKKEAQALAREKAAKTERRREKKVAKRLKKEDPSINTVVSTNSGKAFSDGNFTKALAGFYRRQMAKGKEQIQKALDSVESFRKSLESKGKPEKRSHELAFKIAGLTSLEKKLHEASLPEQIVYARKKSSGPGTVSVSTIDQNFNKFLAA